jgi:HSP20 family molecular chaperone IbpA
MSGENANTDKPKINLASMARKIIGEFSDIGNDVVDTFIQPLETRNNETEITIRDYPNNKYKPVISKRDDCRLITLYIPGAGSGDIDIHREDRKIDIHGGSPETFPDEKPEFQGWGNDGRMTYHYSINIPMGYKRESVKAQLRNGLLKLYFELLSETSELNDSVNIT